MGGYAPVARGLRGALVIKVLQKGLSEMMNNLYPHCQLC